MPARIFESSTSSNELSFAILPAETRIYHYMIVIEEWICWKIFQCKRVMPEKDLFSQLRCCHSFRVTKAGSRQLRSAIFPDKTTNGFKILFTLYHSLKCSNELILEFRELQLVFCFIQTEYCLTEALVKIKDILNVMAMKS